MRVAEGFQKYSLMKVWSCKWFSQGYFTVAAIEMGYGLVGVELPICAAALLNLPNAVSSSIHRTSNLKLDLRLSNKESLNCFLASIYGYSYEAFAFISYKLILS